MNLFDILIWKGNVINPVDELMRRRGSLYSHGSIYVGPTKITHPKTGQIIEGDQIEATVGGVQLSWTEKYKYRDCKVLQYIDPVSQEKQRLMSNWLIRKIGDPYEYKSFLGYLGFPVKDDPNKEVCVELIAELFTEHGFQVWGAETPDFIYPRDILINPKFKLVQFIPGLPRPEIVNEFQAISGPC